MDTAGINTRYRFSYTYIFNIALFAVQVNTNFIKTKKISIFIYTTANYWYNTYICAFKIDEVSL